MRNLDNLVTCVICGKQYPVCKKCDEHKGIWKSWRLTACSMQCYEISRIINSYFYNQISAAEAKAGLIAQKYSDVEMLPDVEKIVDKIMFEAKPVETAEKKITKVAPSERTK